MISREEAYAIVEELVANKNLIKHMLCVEACLADYAKRLGQNEQIWSIAGLLHDADWEKFPDEHPKEIVRKLKEMNEKNPGHIPVEIITSISGHGNGGARFTKRESLLDYYLFACDELSGFVVACALLNPEKLAGVKVSSVIKRFKDKAFARGVNREDIYEGVTEINIPMEEHVQNVINSLLRIKDQLEL